MELIIQTLTPNGIMLAIFFAFIFLSKTLNYHKSDKLHQFLFANPIEKTVYFISTKILKFISSLICSIISFCFIMKKEDNKFNIPDFLSSLKNDTSLLIANLILIITFVILFVILINLTNSIFNKKEFIDKKYYFYLKDHNINNINKIKTNTPIYIVEFISDNEILCFYYLNKEIVRIIIPYELLIGINIHTQKEKSFSEECLYLYNKFESLSRTKKRLFYIFYFIYFNISTALDFSLKNLFINNIFNVLLLLFLSLLRKLLTYIKKKQTKK